MQSKHHWETVYGRKAPAEVSWFQEHAELSLKLIQNAKIPVTAAIIDVGGGASVLVDDLLAHGYENVTVLDISGAALAVARARLDDRGEKIRWLESDILGADLPLHGYDVWHDRAVFHFLTAPEDRQAYIELVLHTVKPGGLVLVATFAEDGPTECSGLPVMRYSADELHDAFGEPFILLGHEKESHKTPAGKEQQFVYCLCRKADS
jgi:SAM-dependent methyltransferase